MSRTSFRRSWECRCVAFEDPTMLAAHARLDSHLEMSPPKNPISTNPPRTARFIYNTCRSNYSLSLLPDRVWLTYLSRCPSHGATSIIGDRLPLCHTTHTVDTLYTILFDIRQLCRKIQVPRFYAPSPRGWPHQLCGTYSAPLMNTPILHPRS